MDPKYILTCPLLFSEIATNVGIYMWGKWCLSLHLTGWALEVNSDFCHFLTQDSIRPIQLMFCKPGNMDCVVPDDVGTRKILALTFAVGHSFSLIIISILWQHSRYSSFPFIWASVSALVEWRFLIFFPNEM